MLSAPSNEFVAGLQALPVAVSLIGLGYLVADTVVGRRAVDSATRWCLALPGLVLFALVLMLLHIATRGAIFGNATLVRLLTVVAAAAMLGRKLLQRDASDPPRRTPKAVWVALVAVVALGVVVWGSTAFRMLPLPYGRDIRLHTGWTHQLLSGDPTPSAGLIGDIPNYYPWLYHSLLALTTLFTPGGRALGAIHPLFFLQVIGALLAFFGCGRALTGSWKGGVAGAVLGGITGGFGYFLTGGPEVVIHTRAHTLDFMGDLLVLRSPNLAMHNLAPPLPRDLGFALMPALFLLLIVGLKRDSVFWLACGGVVLGMMGLVGPDAFIVACAAVALLVLFPGPTSRIKVIATVALPAVALFSLWAAPLIYNYIVLDGFEETFSTPVELPFYALLFAWGVAAPAAALGLIVGLRKARSDAGARVAVAAMTASLAVIALAAALPHLLGTGATTLGYQHRYWPVLYGSLALFGVLGAVVFVGRIGRSAGWAAMGGIVLIAAAVPSPVLAALALPTTVRDEPLLYDALTGDPASVLNALAPSAGLHCNAAVPEELGVPAFAYSGYRLVLHPLVPDPNEENRARIRWSRASLDLESDVARKAANDELTGGATSPTLWRGLVERYDLDRVVLPEGVENRLPMDGYEVSRGRTPDGKTWVVVETDDCE